jgi:hypothetical protein
MAKAFEVPGKMPTSEEVLIGKLFEYPMESKGV